MTLPDGKEVEDQAAAGAGETPVVEQAVAMHQEQADATEAAGERSDLSAAVDRQAAAGTSLAETEASAAVDPLPVKTAQASERAAPRTLRSVLLDYSAHAAMIVGLIGFAWTVSDHVVTHPTAAQIEAPGPAAPTSLPQHTAEASTQATGQVAAPGGEAKRDEVAELRAANERMARDVDALRVELGTLQAALQHDRTPDQVRALAGDLEGVKAGLKTVKNETGAAIAALSGKVDEAKREADAKVRQLTMASGSLERKGVDTTATGSIGPNEKLAEAKPVQIKPVQIKPVQTGPSPLAPSHALPVPAAKPAPAARLANAEDPRKDEGRRTGVDKVGDDAAKPVVLPGWVVREVYQGVALIEGRRGEFEVVPGVSIPGAGVVKSIDRHGNGWTVTTTKGLLASAAPPREYRRAVRDYYPYDF